MKKFLSIAFIAASLVACNGGSQEEAPAVDSTAVAPADTAAVAPAADSTAAADTAAKVAADTAKKAN